jgi:phage terminase large subunit
MMMRTTNKVKIKIHKRIFNDVYLPYLDSRNRYQIYYGGAGSGKSWFIAQRMIMRMLNEKGHKILVVRKVGRTNRHSTFELLKAVIYQFKAQELFKIRENDMHIKCANGNQIIFFGLDNVNKLKSIFGVTDIWIEEADEVSQSDFEQLNLRLRGKSLLPKQIILSFNPVSAQNWIKGYFFDSIVRGSSVLKTTYKDNRFIENDYRQVLEDLKEKDLTFYKIYALGDWGEIGNLIFTHFIVTEDFPKVFDDIIYGGDFGYNAPTAVLKIGVKDLNFFVSDEIYERKMTNTMLIRNLRSFVNNRNSEMFFDSAEPDRIEEIALDGFNAYAAEKSIINGINCVKSKNIYVHPRCIEFINEMNSYKWKEDRNGNPLDEPVKFLNHAMDALRYAIYTYLKNIGAYATQERDKRDQY